VNKRLDQKRKVSAFDIQCVRKVYDIDSNPAYSGMLKFGSRQYSDAFIDWMIDYYKKDPAFFDKARKVPTRSPK